MVQYLFYTFEGSTVSPNNTVVENLQILGIEDGLSSANGLKKPAFQKIK